MKLQTSIKPRKDGTVKHLGLDGVSYVFSADDSGDLVCDVGHEPTVAQLLMTGWFAPVEEQDFAAAIALTDTAKTDDEADEEVFSEGDGLPVEANTPPVRAKSGPKSKSK